MFHLMFLCYYNNNIWQHGHPWKTNPGIEWVYIVWHIETKPFQLHDWHWYQADTSQWQLCAFIAVFFLRSLLCPDWSGHLLAGRSKTNSVEDLKMDLQELRLATVAMHDHFPIVFKIRLIAVMLLNILTQYSAFWRIHFCQSECFIFTIFTERNETIAPVLLPQKKSHENFLDEESLKFHHLFPCDSIVTSHLSLWSNPLFDFPLFLFLHVLLYST